MKTEQRFRKLHVVVAEELFQKIKQQGQLPNIDSLVGNLLAKYLEEVE